MGGGAIRAAAKVAGLTAAAGGIRSIAEHYPLTSAARKVSGLPAVAAAADDVKLVASNSESGVQKPCLEFDDWVLPEVVKVEEMGIDGADRMPRVVFGGPPTLQEAKEATSELSVALEKAFLSSPNSIGNEGSVVAGHGSGLPLSNKEDIVTKTCVSTSEIVGVQTLPAPAIMAFKFLHESSMAKDVVASIACDANVWNAVLQNQDLQNFLQSQSAYENSAVRFDYEAKCFDGASEYAESNAGSGFKGGFKDFFNKMKITLADLLNNLSSYFKNLFGGMGTNVNADTVMERSFMGLAIMAILVILLKRA